MQIFCFKKFLETNTNCSSITFTSERPFNIRGNDEFHQKGDSFDSRIIESVRQSNLFNSPLDKSPGHRFFKKPSFEHFKKFFKSDISKISFFSVAVNKNGVLSGSETTELINCSNIVFLQCFLISNAVSAWKLGTSLE